MRRALVILSTLFFVLPLMLGSVGCSVLTGGAGSSGDGSDGLIDGNIPRASAGSGALADVNFQFDSASLDRGAQDTLRNNQSWLTSNESEKVVIEGHCDERGTAEYNLALGERRAQSVQNYLISLGVSSKQLSTVSYGEELPLDSSNSEQAWSANRRAHFALRK